MARKKSNQVQKVVNQYGGLLALLVNQDTEAAAIALSSLVPDDRQGFLGQVIGGDFRVPQDMLPWLVENVGAAGDKGYAMTTALLMQKFDLLPLLHSAGFILARTDIISNTMVAALAQGKWPHPDLLWPDVIDACKGDQVWVRLVRPAPQDPSRQLDSDGLNIEHLTRIDALSHINRPPEAFSTALATLGWEGPGAAARIFSQDKHLQALGWMHCHGWVDPKTIEKVGSTNTQWRHHMDEVLDFIRAQGEALDIEGKTPTQSATAARPRF